MGVDARKEWRTSEERVRVLLRHKGDVRERLLERPAARKNPEKENVTAAALAPGRKGSLRIRC